MGVCRCRECGIPRAGRLRSRWEHTVHIVAAGGSQSTVQSDHATTMSARETEKVTVRDLLRSGRCANFGNGCWRDEVRPELVPATCSSEQQKSVGGCLGRPRTTGQLRANPN